MPLSWIVYILTALAGVVVVLTRIRLGGDKAGAGRLQISKTLLNTHTIVGLAALMTWTAFLITGAGDKEGNSLIGIAGLAALAGQALRGRCPRRVERGARPLDPRARGHAGRRQRLHLGVPHLGGVTRCSLGPPWPRR